MGLGAAMRACVAAQQWQTALSLFRSPDAVLFAAQVAALQAAGHWRRALQAVAVAEELLGPSLRLRCAAMAAAPWHVALSALDAMRQEALEVDLVAYSSCISSCSKAQQWQKALDLFAVPRL